MAVIYYAAMISHRGLIRIFHSLKNADNDVMKKTINNPRYESLIAWLVNARKKQGLTVRQFAEIIDESHQFVNKVETFQRKLNVYEYVQYCEALGLEPAEGLRFLKKC